MASSLVDDTTTATATQQQGQRLDTAFRSEGNIDLTRHSASAAQITNSAELARFESTRDLGRIHHHSSRIGEPQSTRIGDSRISQQLGEPILLSDTAQEALEVNETNSHRQRISAAADAPGSAMGCSSTNQSDIRGPLDASIKMERTPSLHSSSSGTKDADDTLSTDSPNSRGGAAPSTDPTMTPHSPQSPVGSRLAEGTEALSASAFGTPSTISTAPSTDEASADGTESVGLGLDRAMWRLDDTVAPPMLLPRNPIVQSIPARDSARQRITTISSPEAASVSGDQMYHRRSRSWEEQQLRQHAQTWDGSPAASPYPSPRRQGSHAGGAWEQAPVSQSRVASFRNSVPGNQAAHGFSNVAPPTHPDGWHQVPHRHAHGQHGHVDARSGPGYQQGPFGGFHGQRSTGYAQHPPGSHTPPRSKQQPRSPLHTPSRSPSAPSTPVSASASPSGANLPRSSAEILKTLLRKKACLYEPDTSRAVAFVTWLVGRELALELGYFSRQQLQSGVHASVAKKIDSGTITRTKVNRCMQIILNSCFHYIIPRPDGSEENGEAFRESFASAAADDSSELQALPAPWNDLVVNKDLVLAASSRETSPENSPHFGSQQSKPADDSQSKRAVLLCFNENVRSFQDVLRCHNEFIRDTANAANLQLSDKEWRAFFGRDTVKTTMAWGSRGASTAVTRAEGDTSKLPDALGRMDVDVLSRFRTTWCAKRYDHDHDLCAFAHLEVNGGWLRRNPSVHQYRPSLCPSIVRVTDKVVSPFSFTLNQCEKGEACDFAHSGEEISYHPDQYKRKMCTAGSTKGGSCPLGDICPNFHTAQNVPRGKRRASPDRRSHGSHHQRGPGFRNPHGHGAHSTGKAATSFPLEGAPMLYIHPAPLSDFEKHLALPGLQNLFRRHSSVVAGHLRHGEKCKSVYSNFGDDWGIGCMGAQSSTQKGLPSTPARSSQ